MAGGIRPAETGVTGEYGFLTDAPNAGKIEAAVNLCFVAEDVLEGVRLSLNALNRSQFSEKLNSRQRLELATYKFLKWLEDLPKIRCRPFIVTERPLEVYRLGRLLADEYALYDPVTLMPSRKYHINYVCGHTPPHHSEKLDTLPGMGYQKQLYLGYAPPKIGDMDGYAISLNQLLILEEQETVRFGAEAAPDLQIPYYRVFPSLSPARPAERR